MTPPRRSPLRLTVLLGSFDVEHAVRYQPRDGLTWCNRLVSDVTAAMDCPVPFRLANEQCLWLDSAEAASEGWSRVGAAEALQAVSKGEAVVVGWRNPEGHGHVAMGAPGATAQLHIAQAGGSCFNSKPVRAGFGSHPVHIWRHS